MSGRGSVTLAPREGGLDLVERLRLAAAVGDSVELRSDDLRRLIEEVARARRVMGELDGINVSVDSARALLARRMKWSIAQIIGTLLTLALAVVGALHLVGWLA